MSGSEGNSAQRGPNPRLGLLVGTLFFACIVASGIGDWRDHYLFLVNTTDSLPNWAFLIDRGRAPAKGDYVFFVPPKSALVRRHFGEKPRLFGKIVYGTTGDIVGHDGLSVTINGREIARMKARTRFGEPLTPGDIGRIPEGCLFAATSHRDGFDSRYREIGFVCRGQIVGTGVPIL